MSNKMKKRYLTVFFYKTMDKVFLYKDTGSIAYGLAKYHNYKASFGYLDICGEIKDVEYEKYVELLPIKYHNNIFIKWKNIIVFIWKMAKKYDVINFYFGGRQEMLLALVAKISNSKVKIYVKMDLLKKFYHNQINSEMNIKLSIKHMLVAILSFAVDLYTVECSAYVQELNKLKRFSGKIKYLTNGFFSDLVKFDREISKEKIILTVGRIGTVEKNTEMLVEAIKLINQDKIQEWKVYLVGPVTNEFKIWYEKELEERPYLKTIFVMTGNISNKKKLYEIYAKSSVFVLTSRWESWGLVLVEAAHFKNYTIVTDCCDSFREFIIDGDRGFGKIIPNENVGELKIALEDVLDNKVDYNQKGNLAGKFVDERFDWKLITKQLKEYLEGVYNG